MADVPSKVRLPQNDPLYQRILHVAYIADAECSFTLEYVGINTDDADPWVTVQYDLGGFAFKLSLLTANLHAPPGPQVREVILEGIAGMKEQIEKRLGIV